MTGLWPEQSAFRIPAGQVIFPFLKWPTPVQRATRPPIQSVPVSHVGATGWEAAGVGGWPVTPYSAEVTNEGSYTSIPPVCHRGVRRINFTTVLFLTYGASITETGDWEMWEFTYKMCCAQYTKYVKPFEFRNDGAPCSSIDRYNLKPEWFHWVVPTTTTLLARNRIPHNSPKLFAWNSLLTSTITFSIIWAWSVRSGSMRNCLLTCIKL